MSLSVEDLKKHFQKNQKNFLEELFALLRFKSISTSSEFKKETAACYEWLNDWIKSIGFKTEKWECDAYPTLYAEELSAGPNKPTVLIYGHYDVQPADPEELWKTPAFEPEVRDGYIFARGANDNKGNLFASLLALRYIKETRGSLGVNVKLVIEGEEEIGSPGLCRIVKDKADQLKADYLLIPDMNILGENAPAITLGLRGVVTLEVVFEETSMDLHSGTMGGLALNPIHALVEVLAKMRDFSTGKVRIPHFYDGIKERSKEEIAQLEPANTLVDYLKEAGSLANGGEKAYSALERGALRPTLEINGISGGYAGEGFKTVIPSKAVAKISCRLVEGQNPEKVLQSVRHFILSHTPDGIKAKITLGHGAEAATGFIDSDIVQIVADAYGEVFGAPCKYIVAGGSVGVTKPLQEASGAQLALMGFGIPEDAIHSPNERFSLGRLEKGFATQAKILEKLSS